MENLFAAISVQDIAQIIGIVLGIVVTRVALPYIQANTDAKTYESLCTLIYNFVASAQQQFSDSVVKNEYVVAKLEGLGYTVDDAVNDIIEAAVFEVKQKEAESKVSTDA